MLPILIAECCQNHNGDREILKRMIHAAAESGADYVKIQSLRSRDITYRQRFEEGVVDSNGVVRAIKRPYQAEVDRLSKLDLSPEVEAWFVDECVRAGVAPMTTAFTRAAVREIKDMGYEAIKIASYDCRSYPLLRDVMRWWSRLFVSTGGTYDEEIERAAQTLTGKDFTFLHCVTIYPTPMSEQNLRRINWLRQYTPNVGFSDHTLVKQDGLWASKIALALGATCIERHFTVLDVDQTRDGPVSITPSMLKDLRAFSSHSRYEQMEIIRHSCSDWEQALGCATRTLSHIELLNRDYYAGRVASKVNGHTIFNWEDVELELLIDEDCRNANF